jgi:hypothetical protein
MTAWDTGKVPDSTASMILRDGASAHLDGGRHAAGRDIEHAGGLGLGSLQICRLIAWPVRGHVCQLGRHHRALGLVEVTALLIEVKHESAQVGVRSVEGPGCHPDAELITGFRSVHPV